MNNLSQNVLTLANQTTAEGSLDWIRKSFFALCILIVVISLFVIKRRKKN